MVKNKSIKDETRSIVIFVFILEFILLHRANDQKHIDNHYDFNVIKV